MVELESIHLMLNSLIKADFRMHTPIEKADVTEEVTNQLLDRFDAEFEKSFDTAVSQMKSTYTIEEIERFVEQGIILEKIDELSQQWSIFSDVVIAGIIASGVKNAEEIAKQLGIFINFDVINVRLVEQLRNARLDLISGLTQQQRDVTRASLIESATRGLNPRNQAILIRDTIGLTDRQEQAVYNYRKALENNSAHALNLQLRDKRFDPTVRRANFVGEALTSEQIDRMVERYRERSLASRAEKVARTESLRAAHAGQHEMFMQAIDANVIDGRELERTWLTAQDVHVRESHNGMNGQKRGIDELFISDDGNFLMYPGDGAAPPEEVINCRCTVTVRFRRNNIEQF